MGHGAFFQTIHILKQSSEEMDKPGFSDGTVPAFVRIRTVGNVCDVELHYDVP